MIPSAIISDEALDKELTDWRFIQNPDAPKAKPQSCYPVDHLLVLLTHFTRARGCNPIRSHAMVVLQSANIGVFEQFQTPNKYRDRQVFPGYYWRIFLALHYHRNELTSCGGKRATGTLSSFCVKQDHLTVTIQPLYAQPITWRLDWQQAVHPSSIFQSFPPLLSRRVSGNGPVMGRYTTAGTSASTDHGSHSNARAARTVNVRRSTQDRYKRKMKRRTDASDVKSSPPLADAMSEVNFSPITDGSITDPAS